MSENTFGALKHPDFNYPKDVSKEALADLTKAQKNGDGPSTINALIRYSVAESLISDDNAQKIIDKTEQCRAAETRPDCKALLAALEAKLYTDYSNTSSSAYTEMHEQYPADITEWNQNDFAKKVNELFAEAFCDKAELAKHSLSEYKSIIDFDDASIKFYPTLLDFIYQQYASNQYVKTDKKALLNEWATWHKGDVAPSIYLKVAMLDETTDFAPEDSQLLTLYGNYKQFEESGFILSKMDANLQNYAIFNDYVARYPKSAFLADVTDKIYSIESKLVMLDIPSYHDSTSKIAIKINHRNVSDLEIRVYKGALKRYDQKLSTLPLLKTYTVTIDKKQPYATDVMTFEIDPLPYGEYTIVPAFKVNGKTIECNSYAREHISISDLYGFYVVTANSKTADFYVVNATDGKPVSGATLMNKNGKFGVSDKNGIVTINQRQIPADWNLRRFNFVMGADKYSPEINASKLEDEVNKRYNVALFTDLAIYRPAETVKYSAIAYSVSDSARQVVKNKRVIVNFYDSNHKIIATDTLTTDKFGRANGEFIVPTDRMNGTFSLEAGLGFDNKSEPTLWRYSSRGYKRIEVSEYKAPTYELAFTNAKSSYNKNEDVIIAGKATTYAGMPVAGAEVTLDITKESWFFWFNSGSEFVKQDTVTTDANGEFTLTLPYDTFEENKNNRLAFIYKVNARCTNNTGESQETMHRFFVGKHRRIQLGEELTFINDKPINLPVIIDSSDENDKNFTCNYTLTTTTDSTKVVANGKFTSDNKAIDLTKVPSGKYVIRIADESGLAQEAKSEIVLYHKSDKVCPVESHLWIPECGRSVDSNNVAHITIGTSDKESYVFFIARSKSKVVTKGWKKYAAGIHDFTMRMPEGENETLQFSFLTVNSFVKYAEEVVLKSNNTKQMVLETTSFRDKLVPGSKEKWCFTIKDNNGGAMAGAALLAMTDKAISSIMPNNWRFNPDYTYRNVYYLTPSDASGTMNAQASWQKEFDGYSFSLEPSAFNLYGYELFARSFRSFRKFGMNRAAVVTDCVATEAMAAPMMMSKSAKAEFSKAEDEMATNEEVSDAGATVGSEEESTASLENIQMRESDIKTALWLPNITSKPDGTFYVEFEVPNFNTTWIVQALAYSNDLYADVMKKEVVTSKPIMVKANMPRFLRSGDKVTLAANIANKTDETVKYDGVIELFDPRTGDIVKSQKISGELAPMTDGAVAIDYDVTSEADFVGYRVKATNGNFGDGEQVMVPVLSNISPVVETEPFFINAGDKNYSSALPKFPNNARITLEYCDNPVWYCATALPTIFDKDARTSSQLAHSLFALTLAEGIAKDNPKIAEAVKHWKAENKEDGALTSMLAKNQDLKIGTLLASPWINEADRQTLRMSKLDELFDKEICNSKQNDIITKLSDLQLSDGGFTWIKYPGSKSSLFATGEVLELIGELHHLGYLTGNSKIKTIEERAIKYYDAEYLQLLEKAKISKANTYIGFSEYAYIRTLFNHYAMPATNKAYFNRIISDIEKDWKDASLGQKAFYAITLQRNGKSASARKLIESVRQFSITTPSRGMYWDRISNNWWFGSSKLKVTALILEAMHEIDGKTDEINQIRKWMLLNKQTNDWGGSSLASDAVYAILSTGDHWLTEGKMPNITIGDKKVEFDNFERYIGYARKELTLNDASGADINIDRTDGTSPAWGSVYCQYAAPMKTIQSAKIDDLSIEKSYLVYANDGKLLKAKELKVGDKVKIQCTVKCGKDMSFVTLKDERGACFEPVDKTSDYDCTDGVWLYRETKDSVTNMFIQHLSKGTHIITYDAYVTNPGTFDIGIATIQCQYAPQMTAHSAGCNIIVK